MAHKISYDNLFSLEIIDDIIFLYNNLYICILISSVNISLFVSTNETNIKINTEIIKTEFLLILLTSDAIAKYCAEEIMADKKIYIHKP